MTERETRWAVLEPLDTVAIRDGRPFDAGTQSMARTVPPTPATVAGAIGRALDDIPGQVHGPVVVRRRVRSGPASPAGWDALFPVPADVVRAEDGTSWSLLTPAPTGSEKIHTDLPEDLSLMVGEGVPVGGWWSRRTMQAYLSGRGTLVDRLDADPQGLSEPSPWSPERRVGLTRTVDRTAADGLLYSTTHLRLCDDVALAARCVDLPPHRDRKPVARTVPFGGEGRRAEVHWLDEQAVDLPAAPTDFPGGRLLVYLATPALFSGGWRPPPEALDGEVRVVGAVVSGPQVISTGRPDPVSGAVRRTRLLWAAPAGSVYFLVADSAAAAARVAAWHGRLLTADSPFPQIEDGLVTAGFGLVLIGSW